MDERLKKQLAFVLEIDKEKNIFRQTHLSGHGRRENDAEHAWHMAVMAGLLQEYSNEEVDLSRVMRMCLIHDIVEIDAGDTYAYDQEGLATQKAREDAAKERIFSLLPQDQKEELISLFDEFEACGTPEARFAHAMDNLQPLLLNDSNGGGDWRKHAVTAEQVYGRQRKTRLGSEKLYQVTDSIIQKNIREGNIEDNPPETAGQNHQMDCVREDASLEITPSLNSCSGQAAAAAQALEELYGTVARLRAPDGCPWDRAQTHDSLKAACVEEAAEVLGGINILARTGKPGCLQEELGDLLLQVMMHAQIASEEGLFTLEDVIRGINEKMIRRHPHIFPADRDALQKETDKEKAAAPDARTVSDNWQKLKEREKAGREWEEPFLFEAFTEAEALIGVARARKQKKQ